MGNKHKKKYDLICSMGGNCAAANNLKLRDLRPYSLPLDWIAMVDLRPLKYLPEGFRTNFKGLALKENMEPITDANLYAYQEGHGQFRDKVTGFDFIHHFTPNMDNYESAIAVFHKRCVRFMEQLKQMKSVLFVLSTRFEFDLKYIKEIDKTLKELYPNCQFDYEIMQFYASKNGQETIDNIHVQYIMREFNSYDFDKSNYEWSFLDNVCLTHPLSSHIKLFSIPFFGRKIKAFLDIER